MTESDFFENTVKIVVGKGEKKIEIINIPRDRLSDVSEFFAAGYSDRWTSGLDGVIEFEEVDLKIFKNLEDYVIVEDKDENVDSPFPASQLLSTWTAAPRARLQKRCYGSHHRKLQISLQSF